MFDFSDGFDGCFVGGKLELAVEWFGLGCLTGGRPATAAAIAEVELDKLLLFWIGWLISFFKPMGCFFRKEATRDWVMGSLPAASKL